jgi:3-methyl-2-oxobutanoate hydroxymethyltransferase
MAGLNRGRVPRFVERYGDLGGVLADAAVRFAADVRAGVYLDEEHSYS